MLRHLQTCQLNRRSLKNLYISFLFPFPHKLLHEHSEPKLKTCFSSPAARLLEADSKSMRSMSGSRRNSGSSLVSSSSASSNLSHLEEDTWILWGRIVNEWDEWRRKKDKLLKVRRWGERMRLVYALHRFSMLLVRSTCPSTTRYVSR